MGKMQATKKGEKRKNIWYSENNGIRIRITG